MPVVAGGKQACIEACNTCATDCLACADAMTGKKSQNDCPNCCLECAAICRACADVLAIDGEHAAECCRLCMEVCLWCEALCVAHTHAHCQQCAESCRRCAEACQAVGT